ncbi:uridine kinase [Anoxynatronum buryatiense]|uniref:Uridine kinase n=1 Tax=Anoxynatronum buryatiense TaxID=489973 RepID=A0AA46AIH3_9CLOT|nr:uridine kinase [Anoxynatronum buryatiense]SMP48941.1 uridine kinase [Anoxynatronum buryatiense]
MSKPILIGITGGTGSGKSTVSRQILKHLPEQSIAIIPQDAYYKNQDHLPLEERIKVNYDHPFSFETDLLTRHLKALQNGESIEMPQYDFERHTRKKETLTIESRNIIILEGILLFDDPDLRELMDIKIFVDTDADVRIIRRIMRDIKERGRSLDSVINQYMTTVRPAHLQFVEPNKKYADIIIPEGGKNQVAIDIIVTKIKAILED